MRPQDLVRLVALAAAWGASYLFMRYAVPFLGPIPMIEMRVMFAGLLLAALLYARRQAVGWRQHWRGYMFVGVIGMGVPFVLIAEALQSIDASTAAILNALSPLFASIFATIWIKEPITPAKAGGIALCLVGTAVLVGWTPAPMTPKELLAAAMSVAATVIYGFTIVFTKVKLKGASPMGSSAATLLFAGLALLPFMPLKHDYTAVPTMAWLALAGLVVFSTLLAFLLYYRLIADVGPVKAITVTLLVPVFGML
ncbi:MAG: EamA family transporter, partial [Usitatibacter sp.]